MKKAECWSSPAFFTHIIGFEMNRFIPNVLKGDKLVTYCVWLNIFGPAFVNGRSNHFKSFLIDIFKSNYIDASINKLMERLIYNIPF